MICQIFWSCQKISYVNYLNLNKIINICKKLFYWIHRFLVNLFNELNILIKVNCDVINLNGLALWVKCKECLKKSVFNHKENFLMRWICICGFQHIFIYFLMFILIYIRNCVFLFNVFRNFQKFGLLSISF